MIYGICWCHLGVVIVIRANWPMNKLALYLEWGGTRFTALMGDGHKARKLLTSHRGGILLFLADDNQSQGITAALMGTSHAWWGEPGADSRLADKPKFLEHGSHARDHYINLQIGPREPLTRLLPSTPYIIMCGIFACYRYAPMPCYSSSTSQLAPL